MTIAITVNDNATGAAFWTLNSANDAGSPLTEVLGNGVLITSGYKPWTHELTSRQQGTGGSTNNLQDLAYQWDLNGNLHQRQDLKQGLTEIFVNDPLNRLTDSTLNEVSNLSVGYNAAGNISIEERYRKQLIHIATSIENNFTAIQRFFILRTMDRRSQT